MNDEFLMLLKQIDDLIGFKEYASAKRLLDDALIKDIMNPELWRRKAIIYEKQHPKERAQIRKNYEQAIAVGDVTESSKLLNKVIKLDKNKKIVKFIFGFVIGLAFAIIVFVNGGSDLANAIINPEIQISFITATPSATFTPTALPSATQTVVFTASPTYTKTPVMIYSRTNDQLAVRKGAGVEFDVITTLRIGDSPKVLGRNKDGSWVKIQIGNDIKPIIGWIRLLPEHVIVSGDLGDLPYASQ